MKRIAVVLAVASVLSGCTASDQQMKPPSAQARSDADQIKDIQNDPNLSDDAKAKAVAQLQRGAHGPAPTQNAHQ